MNVTDVTPLASLTKLTKLDLHRCSNITDLTPLVSLKKLTTLYLHGYSSKITAFAIKKIAMLVLTRVWPLSAPQRDTVVRRAHEGGSMVR